MKTFRLCSINILFDEPPEEHEMIKGREVPLVEGLIINKEEAEKSWLLEAVLDQEWDSFFRDYLQENQTFMAEVTITNRTNDPATLVCRVSDVHQLHEHIVVHMQGDIVAKKDDLSDMLLRNLLDEGYEGEALYEEYRRRKKNRGRAIQGILSNAYEQVKEKNFSDE
ncbi:YwpF-like family protein [Alkalicoccus chagannorensis]|uniref:YwpF-like family protein n=1 Tax=Alkalicoccus chagannorensis TaxID=427072 RepID=UPI0004073CCC|nr:YwpF-like family protein [Alkalicoccus chagannorensis]